MTGVIEHADGRRYRIIQGKSQGTWLCRWCPISPIYVYSVCICLEKLSWLCKANNFARFGLPTEVLILIQFSGLLTPMTSHASQRVWVLRHEFGRIYNVITNKGISVLCACHHANSCSKKTAVLSASSELVFLLSCILFWDDDFVLLRNE